MAIDGLGVSSNSFVTASQARLLGGLVYLGSASPSAASSVSISNVFSATYEQYLVVHRLLGSAGTGLLCRLRVGGVDATAANYAVQTLSVGGTSVIGARSTSQTSGKLGALRLNAWNSGEALIAQPFAAANTVMSASQQDSDSTISLHYNSSILADTTSYDSMTFFPETGTFSGSIRVYGYSNS